MKIYSRLFLLAFHLTRCEIIYTQIPIGLKVAASLRGVLLGAAILVNYLRDNIDQGEYNSTIIKNYQLIVPGKELKPQEIWLGRHLYNFVDADWLLGATPNTTGWVQQNGMRLRGHTLIWAYDMRIPRWLLDEEVLISPDEAKELLSDYIHAVVGRYRGKIQWWDVINELISDYNNTRPFYIRDSFWYRKLGVDYIKYAFLFAHEADPDAQLYYNDYGIEHGGFKADRAIEIIDWLKSQGVPIHGFGMQWHIKVSEVVTPGDAHYQNAQRFLDQNIDFMVTELDIAIPMSDGHPTNPGDIQKQGVVYRSVLEFVLHFCPRSPALLIWGVTDRYSWIPAAFNYTEGDALPLDINYQPKPAYWQMQEELARILLDGVYRLSPHSQSNKCLGISGNETKVTLQLYNGSCNQSNQQWNITWLGDGTYRFSPHSIISSALNAYNTTATIGGVEINSWTGNFNQEWVLDKQGNSTYRVGPRAAWWRVLSVYDTSNIGIMNYTSSVSQQWVLTPILPY